MLWLIWMVVGTLPSPALNLTPPELCLHCAAHWIPVNYREASLQASCQFHVYSHLLTASGSSSLTAPCHSVIISALSACFRLGFQRCQDIFIVYFRRGPHCATLSGLELSQTYRNSTAFASRVLRLQVCTPIPGF